MEAKGPADMEVDEGVDAVVCWATAAAGGNGESRGAMDPEALLDVALSSKAWKIALEYCPRPWGTAPGPCVDVAAMDGDGESGYRSRRPAGGREVA